METLQKTIEAVAPAEVHLKERVRAHLDSLTKPPGSLGRLEEIAVRYCLATGTSHPSMGKKRIITFAGDHGVAEEGVSAYPKQVTAQMVRNMLAGGAAVNVLARHSGAEVQVVDVGVDELLEDAAGLCDRKVAPGTRNIAEGPAMTREEAIAAVLVGVELARQGAEEGVTLLGAGEMGIANTTPSAALFAAILHCPVEQVTGRGTGVDDGALAAKVEVVKTALRVNADRLADPLGILAALGGFEIAGICGLALGGASRRVPVVVDGFISTAGALVATRLCERVADYLFFSHCSEEAGHGRVLDLMGVQPLLDLGMRLGEGTGAALAMLLIEAAVKVYSEMATFGAAGVSTRALGEGSRC